MFSPPFPKLGSHKLNFLYKSLKVLNFQSMIQYPTTGKNTESRIKLPEFSAYLCHYSAVVGKLFKLFESQFLQL